MNFTLSIIPYFSHDHLKFRPRQVYKQLSQQFTFYSNMVRQNIHCRTVDRFSLMGSMLPILQHTVFLVLLFICLFVCLLCFVFVYWVCVLCPMLLVFLDCPFWIARLFSLTLIMTYTTTCQNYLLLLVFPIETKKKCANYVLILDASYFWIAVPCTLCLTST